MVIDALLNEGSDVVAVFERSSTRDLGTTCRLHRNHLYLRLMFLEKLSGARHCAARTERSHDCADVRKVCEDLRADAFVIGTRIGPVVKLIEKDILIGMLGNEHLSTIPVSFDSEIADLNDFRAKVFKEVPFVD